jgi:hypothetical protein
MQIAAFILAAYGAVLSSALGYLAWWKERRRVHFSARFVRGHDSARLEISIVNTGFRPVTLESAHFETADGGGYLPAFDEYLGLPCKLAEGDLLPRQFDALDLWAGTAAFVVRAYDREHRHVFDQDFRKQWERDEPS